MYRWILLLLLPLLLTGCWDKKDPEDRVFILALGVDRAEENYGFTLAPADIEKGEAEVYTATAKTLAGAVAQIDTFTSRKTDLGQLKTIILSRDILEERRLMEGLLQELERSRTVSAKVMLLASEGSAADCVEAVMQEDGDSGLFLWDFYKNTAREVAVTKGMDLDTFLTEREERGGNIVLPRISLQAEKLRLGGGIAVSSNKIYSFSDRAERGYLFLLGEAEGALLEEQYGAEILPLEIGKSEVSYEFLPLEEGICCWVTLPLEGTLQGGSDNFLSAEERKEVEVLFSECIKEELLYTMGQAKEADLFGILPRLRQQSPKLAEGAEWKDISFVFQPELSLKDAGRKR